MRRVHPANVGHAGIGPLASQILRRRRHAPAGHDHLAAVRRVSDDRRRIVRKYLEAAACCQARSLRPSNSRRIASWLLVTRTKLHTASLNVGAAPEGQVARKDGKSVSSARSSIGKARRTAQVLDGAEVEGRRAAPGPAPAPCTAQPPRPTAPSSQGGASRGAGSRGRVRAPGSCTTAPGTRGRRSSASAAGSACP